MASGEAHPKRFAMPSFWDCRPLGTTSTASMVSDGSDPPTGSVPPVGATGGAQQRVLSFVDGMLSPFRACVQPPLQSCVTLRPGDAKESSREDPPWVPPAETLEHFRRTLSEYSTASPVSVHTDSHGQTAATAGNLIEVPHANDVLCGRGGSSLKHVGNLNFRALVAANKVTYGGLTKRQKMQMARQIVHLIHHTDPPGRFLARDAKTGYYFDVGLSRSLEKTAQALREKSTNDRGHSDSCPQSPDGDDAGLEDLDESKSMLQHRRCDSITPVVIIPDYLKSVYRIPMTGEFLPASPSPEQVSPYGIVQTTPRGVAVATSPLIPIDPRFQQHHGPSQVAFPSPMASSASDSASTPTLDIPTLFSDFEGHKDPFDWKRPMMLTTNTAYVDNQPSTTITANSPVRSIVGGTSNTGKIASTTDYNHMNNMDGIAVGLSLEERVVGGPLRRPSTPQNGLSSSLLARREMMSPSGSLQSRHHFRERVRGGGTNLLRSTDVDHMDGLAALSTAAFLRLDETD